MYHTGATKELHNSFLTFSLLVCISTDLALWVLVCGHGPDLQGGRAFAWMRMMSPQNASYMMLRVGLRRYLSKGHLPACMQKPLLFILGNFIRYHAEGRVVLKL
jgi:hypothetical protein